MDNTAGPPTDSPPNATAWAEAQLMREAQEAGGIGSWSWDLATGTMTWSAQMFRNLGLTDQGSSASFERLLACVHPADRDVAATRFAAFRRRCGGVRLELRIVWPAGDVHWIVFLGQVKPGADGQPAQMLGITIDGTNRRRGEEAVRDSAERLRLAMQAGGLATWEFDLTRRMGRWSSAAAVMHGLSPTRTMLTEAEWFAMMHDADAVRARAAFADAIQAGGDYSAEYRVMRPDGATRWLHIFGAVLLSPEGRPGRIVGVVHDETARRQADEDLRETEQRFRRVFEQSPLGKAMAGLDFRFRAVNPALCRMVGYDEQELIGASFLDLVHPDDRPHCAQLAGSLIDGRMPQIQLEERFIRRSGEPFWVRVSVGPIRDADGQIRYTMGIIEDIDERKRISQALQESEQRLRELNEQLEQQAEQRARQLASSRAQLQAFFDNSPDWLTLQRVTADGSFVYVDINPTTEAAYGLVREQVIGRTVEAVLGSEEAAIPLQNLRECVRTGQSQRYMARRTMAGRTRAIDVMCVLVPGENAEGERFVITTARDLTEREQLEAQLRQAQKMEAIGHLTGGVAHDFNNLLAVVTGNAELAKRRPQNMPALMDNILRAGERGVALTRQLLSFARRQAPRQTVVDLTVEMPRLAAMLQASLRGDIRLTLNLADGLWPVEVDLDEMEIALLNIALNARDAMPEGGHLTIEARNVEAGAGAAMGGQPHLAVTLHDTGHGIPPDIIAKVFDPFFTTKGRGVGTGLGLSQVYGFAQQSNGVVEIESKPDAGTTVTLRVPRTDKPLPAASDVAKRPASGRSGRILLVEDNPQVAEVTAMMLATLGYETQVVHRARQALEVLQSDPASFDLVLSDVVMPDGMHGLDLAETIRARLPDLPIILMSGYNDAVPANSPFRVLRKPVPLQALREAVGAHLAAPVLS